MEELLLEPLLALHELDVVDEQHVDVAVSPLEVGGGVGTDRVDVLVEERLGAHVAHHVVLVVALHVVPDGVQQVGLAETGGTVDEQWVVAAAGRLGHAQRRGERELVRCTLHERLERVARVHPVVRAVAGGARQAGGGVALRRARRRGRRGGLAGRVGHPGGLGLGLGDLHLHHELHVGGTDLLESIPHQREITRQNSVAGVRVRRTHPHHRGIAVQGHHVLEGGEPHRFGHLRAEQLRNGCPQLFMVRHLRLLSVRRPTSTSLSTSCGQPKLHKVRTLANLDAAAERRGLPRPSVATPARATVVLAAVRGAGLCVIPARRGSGRPDQPLMSTMKAAWGSSRRAA